MSLKLYLSEKGIDNIVDDYDFMMEEYEGIREYCVNHNYILSNEDMEIIKSRGLEQTFYDLKKEYIRDLWLAFGETPMDPDIEEIEESWMYFGPGTHREDIWHWFEDTYNISVAKGFDEIVREL